MPKRGDFRNVIGNCRYMQFQIYVKNANIKLRSPKRESMLTDKVQTLKKIDLYVSVF